MTDPIVQALVAERVLLGLSQREVTRRLGTSSATLWGWERGDKTPSIANVQAWAAALGLEINLAATAKEGAAAKREPDETDDLAAIVRYHGAFDVIDALLLVAAEAFGADKAVENLHRLFLGCAEEFLPGLTRDVPTTDAEEANEA